MGGCCGQHAGPLLGWCEEDMFSFKRMYKSGTSVEGKSVVSRGLLEVEFMRTLSNHHCLFERLISEEGCFRLYRWRDECSLNRLTIM